MAGLLYELIGVIEQETSVYDKILSFNDAKRQAVIDRNAGELERITGQEEGCLFDLQKYEQKRLGLLKDMAVVLGHDGENITVNFIIDSLKKQPDEQEALKAARDALVEKASEVRFWNQENQELLNSAMSMVDFDLNLFKSMRQAPETGNYNKKAYNTGDLLGGSSFDSKQ